MYHGYASYNSNTLITIIAGDIVLGVTVNAISNIEGRDDSQSSVQIRPILKLVE